MVGESTRLMEWVGGDAPRQGRQEERMGCVTKFTLGILHVPARHCLVGDGAPTPGTLWAAGLERDLEQVRPAGGTLQVCREGRRVAPEPRAQGEAGASPDGARENRSSRQSAGRGPPDGCRPPPSEAKLGCACRVLGILTHSPMPGEVTRGRVLMTGTVAGPGEGLELPQRAELGFPVSRQLRRQEAGSPGGRRHRVQSHSQERDVEAAQGPKDRRRVGRGLSAPRSSMRPPRGGRPGTGRSAAELEVWCRQRSARHRGTSPV